MLACTGDCPDPDCRQSAILETWERDPVAAEAMIAELADPIEKVTVITVLAETWPGQTKPLCDQLDGDARVRCRRLNQRPHLRLPPPVAVITTRTAPGPDSPNILPDVPDPFADVTALPALGCEGDIEPKSCRAQRAADAAREGRARTAVGLCRGMPGEARWREECIFQCAEKLMSGASLSRLPDASGMCMASGDFAANCLAHLTRDLAKQAPPSSVPQRGPWTPILAAAATLDEYWSPRDAAFAQVAIDRLWADALSLSYARSPSIVGNPLDLLPEPARPHIHAGAAMRMLGTEPEPTLSLLQQQARLAEALTTRSARPLPPSNVPLRFLALDLWPADAPGEQTIPAGFMPGNARRPVSEDPTTDQILALMEAAARMDPPMLDLIRQGVEHEQEVVRWSAKRLLSALADGASE